MAFFARIIRFWGISSLYRIAAVRLHLSRLPIFQRLIASLFITRKNSGLKIPHFRHILAKGALISVKSKFLPNLFGLDNRDAFSASCYFSVMFGFGGVCVMCYVRLCQLYVIDMIPDV